MKQAYNPYLPSYEYVPDGEPHVYGERVYVYGSHDRFNGANFCLNDYVCYSASIYDLADWRYEGVIFRKDQDPRNQNIPADAPAPQRGFAAFAEAREGDLNPPGIRFMNAPDAVRGPDGRYYLYYCIDWMPEIGVAVCDEPAGAYQFLGFVRHPDGTILGQGAQDLVQFDPGIFVDDDGIVYLYSGCGPARPDQPCPNSTSLVMTLQTDMLTLAMEPKPLLPLLPESVGTEFEGHAFFEASSIRKAMGRYYLVYCSTNSHELCYAISKKPDRDFRFGGTLVDIGDVYLDGRAAKDALNPLGNTHGGMECINGQWYIFYHRHTNRSFYSRQACAEKIEILEDGSIRQAEVTSCGLNKGPLVGEGIYPAYICCQLTGSKGAVFSHPLVVKMDYPYLTQDCPDVDPADLHHEEPVQYIANLTNGSVAGYKYFALQGLDEIRVTLRGQAEGDILIKTDPTGECLGKIPVKTASHAWTEFAGKVSLPEGTHPLYFCFEGSGRIDFQRFTLINRI